MKKFISPIFKMFSDIMFQSKFNAFTLAEVLVTLGIIGVVAAMTMPTLISNHQKTVYVTQLKKVYTELSQAAKRAINDNNLVSLDEGKYTLYNPNAASEFFHTYFNIVQDCGTDLTPCFAENYSNLSGGAVVLYPVREFVGTLASGAAICVFSNLFDLKEDRSKHGYFEIYVDINGQAPPNILGRDLFYMQLYSDGKVAESYEANDYDYSRETCLEHLSGYGARCLSVIIHDGWKMDY